MEVVSAILGPILERVVKPVLNEIGYVFTYSCNVENFTKKVDRMKAVRDGVKERISAEEDNLQVIAPNVKAWLVRADQITQVEERIMNKKPDIEKGWCKGWCPNVMLRYKLSKKAKKSTEDVVELLVEGTTYSNFSRPAPPLQVEFIGHRQYIEFESRKSNEDEIIEALMDDKINLVGICGMGGVGKTMMAKKVGKKVKEEAMFDEVVMVSVGPKPDLKKIQEGIAEALGFQLKEDSLIVRANKLQRRVSLKRTLLILDDVWARLDLEELGISFAHSKECKIMLTSRHRDTCIQMEAQKTVVIEVLKEDEGWSLFKERAGSCVNEPGIDRVAKDVSRECSHLPLALTTVGRALRDKTQHSWEDARAQLRKSAPSNLPEVLKEVYQPLELSYNLLESEEAQSLFLICSLFPEDYCIPLDFLIWYGLGLRVLKNVNGLEEARRRVSRLVEMLEDRFLLDDANEGNAKHSIVNYEKYVKMHHVLRDVAIYIANKEDDVLISTHDIEWPEEMPYERLTCISIVSDALTVLPERLKCPHLNVLRLQCNNATLKVPEDFFHGTPSLLVVDMPGSFLCSLPPSLECLKNLRVLYLHSQRVEDISVIGELKQLEMLICFCSAKALPAKIGSLTNLRVLNMGDTCIQKIAPGIFTQLARLEEVYLINNDCVEGSFLREISTLRHLTCLNIRILTATLLQTNLSFQSFPRRYFVFSSPYYLGEGHLHKAMHLSLPFVCPLGNWVRLMLTEADDLYLDDNGSKVAIDVLGIERFQNVKKLILQYCSNVVFLANTETLATSSQCVFPILESLSLLELKNFLKICNGPFLDGSFRNLQSIIIDACPQMPSLLSLATARGLVKLRDLDVCNCVAMEEVFLNERAGRSFARQKLTFPKLNRIRLENLPNLSCFCHAVEDIEFPQLRQLEITNAPNFTSFCPPQSQDDLEGPSLFDHQVKFGSLQKMTLKRLDGVKEICSSCSFIKLETLRIECCNNLKWLFCPSAAHTFVNLKGMEIVECHKLGELISNEQVRGGSKTVFPKLEKLKISQLPELRVFWQVEHAIELPLLKHLEINQCPKMTSFTHGPLQTRSLNLLVINGKTVDGDVNVALHQHDSS